MTKYFCVLIFLFSHTIFAEDYSYEPSRSSGSGAFIGSLGFVRGGIAIGAEYESMSARTHGFGGALRLYEKDDDKKVNADGIMAIAGFVRPHFKKRPWDFYTSFGPAILMIDDVGGDDETVLGLMFQIGCLYEMSRKMAVGVVMTKHYGWFSDDHKGLKIDDGSVAFRVKF